MPYRVFDPKISGGKGNDYVSINKNSLIFNRKASRKYLDKILYVELYFDEEKNKIGIKPLSEKTEKSLSLRGKNSRAVWARPFLQLYRCIHEETKRYVPTWDDNLKMIEIQL